MQCSEFSCTNEASTIFGGPLCQSCYELWLMGKLIWTWDPAKQRYVWHRAYEPGTILKQRATDGNPHPTKLRYRFVEYTKHGKLTVQPLNEDGTDRKAKPRFYYPDFLEQA